MAKHPENTGLRTFIAADIPSSLQQSIQEQVEQLKSKVNGSPIRWVPTHNLHLTLKFLGDVKPQLLDDIKRAISAAAEMMPPFSVSIGGFGSFPNSKQARVLWVGIQAPAELEALYQNVESACEGTGLKRESRPFSPHLTIGRVRENISPVVRDNINGILQQTQIDSLGMAGVDSIHLYKSDLKSNGAVYTKLFSASLSKR